LRWPIVEGDMECKMQRFAEKKKKMKERKKKKSSQNTECKMQRFADKNKKKRKKEEEALTKCCVLMRAFPSFCLISLSQTVDLDERGWIKNF